MSSVVEVTIHSSQFPEKIRGDLVDSLRRRQLNHKFHYDTVKQAQKWLKLHETYSPARTDPDCQVTYDRSFDAVAARLSNATTQVVGLGCGGGQKDARLLSLLKESKIDARYVPVDVSVALVLVAQRTVAASARRSVPIVCDLASADDLPQVFDRELPSDAERLFTFFGMIPNFEPDLILPRLRSLLRPQDWLLFSANLAPGADYQKGMEKILPLYDNALTRDWLITFLLDLGIERTDGEIIVRIENGSAGLKRIVADFQFSSRGRIQLDEEQFEFEPGDKIRLFFSYRYTADFVRSVFASYNLEVVDRWLTKSEEEGVFLCRRK